MLHKAIEIAEQALAGMTDQNGQPYIEHARRVMDAMDTEEEKIVAILHDVVEDTEMSLKDLMDEGFSHEVVENSGSAHQAQGHDLRRVHRGHQLAVLWRRRSSWRSLTTTWT